jgi:hypothetical protein
MRTMCRPNRMLWVSMNRKSVILSGMVVLMTASTNLHAAESGMRQVQELDRGWRFRYDAPGGAKEPDFDDSSWEKVNVPHTFNADDGARGGGYRRGPGWYRTRFSASSLASRRAYLFFDGSSSVTTVWLNGRELGTHWSATSSFCFDATEALKDGGENLLVVRADNTWRDDVPPIEGDFTIFGGLYRRVRLVFASDPSLDFLDFSGPGLYLTTPEVSKEEGRVRARIRVRNNGKKTLKVVVILKLTDAQGLPVGTVRKDHMAEKGVSEAVLELVVKKPRLWNGVKDPALYRAAAEVWSEDRRIDRVEQPLGFRTFSFDPQKGFILNGIPYDLHGANMHQDREGKGWAITAADREEDLRLLLAMGGTFVRLAHYQHDPTMLDLCDRLGVVVWAEHGLVNKVTPKQAFADRAMTQMRELIRRDFNHPSVFMWGIGNEVQALVQKNQPAVKLLERLSALVKEEDPSRPSVLATSYSETPGTYGVDLVAHNQYHGWYHDTFADFAVWLDAQRAKAPDKCQGMSEYGAGAGANIHRDDPKIMDHSEEWQALFHEAYWRTLRDRPWVFCKAVWNMFDFASDGRNEGEKPGINDKGLVTRDRKTPKDAYFWYQANWTEKPMVYVTSRRFTPRVRAATEVKVYSNCDRVSLTLNGKPAGEKRVNDHVARWQIVLRAGVNHVSVEGVKDKRKVKDFCTWTLER